MTQSAKRESRTTTSRPARQVAQSPIEIARAAAQQLCELTGREPDTTSGLQRTDNGWLVHVEVVEVARIPDSTSVMASYEVEVDTDGALISYRRARRYYRNQAGDV